MTNIKILKLLSVFLVTVVALSMSVFTVPILKVQAATTTTNTSPAIHTYAAGFAPINDVFDGSNIWVSNTDSNTVTKLRASDGSILGTYAVGTYPYGICFDGTNIWVANYNSNNVTELRASDGTILGTYPAGQHPMGICFDGTNIWITNASSSVTKLSASNGSILGTFAVNNTFCSICCDGTNIWVTNALSNCVTKLRASDGYNLGSYTVGPKPYGICFDGTNIWVTNNGYDDINNGSITKLNDSDGSVLGTYTVGIGPIGICSDGTSIWVANWTSNTVIKLRSNDGLVLGTYAVGTQPQGICFDGNNVWVANHGSDSVTKIPITAAPITTTTTSIPVITTSTIVQATTTTSTEVAPPPPSYVSPSNYSTVSTIPTLSWRSNGGTSYTYSVCLSTYLIDGNPNNINSSWSSETSWQPPATLVPGTYAWHVLARNQSGVTSDASSLWNNGVSSYGDGWWEYFTYAPVTTSSATVTATTATTTATTTTEASQAAPPPPSYVSPSNYATISTIPTLSWRSNGGTSYTFSVILSNGSQNVQQSPWITGTSWQVSAPLAPGGYAWHVLARNQAGVTSDASSLWSNGVSSYGDGWWEYFTYAPVTTNIPSTTKTTTTTRTTITTTTSAPLNWTVSLSVSNAHPQANQSITLTATTNHDVGPTAWGLYIIDTTTNGIVAKSSSGTSCTCSSISYVGATHNFVARIGMFDGSQIQDTSNTVSVTWANTSSSVADLSSTVVNLALGQVGKTIGTGYFAGIPWVKNGDTYCDTFVSAILSAAWGKPISNPYYSGYATAYDHYLAQKALIQQGTPPQGAIVYYGETPTNYEDGHVGIADGKGNLISVYTVKDGVTRDSLNSMGAPILGWIYPSEYFSTR